MAERVTGLYVHIPFCQAKCPYCDFYSLPAAPELQRQYADTVCREMEQRGGVRADTLYFGGGTPSLLAPELIGQIIRTARDCFALDGEITMELNPGTAAPQKLEGWRAAGVNRLSVGVQSADPEELRLLGRRHTAGQAAQTLRWAKQAGFDNLSADLMLAIPRQTVDSLRRSIAFLTELDVCHLSAYLLKIEPGTPFARNGIEDELPDEDTVCALYLTACEELERAGLAQYEISNFARPGAESRHNLKYWRCGEYLGFGPAAHSFFGGRRFYQPRDLPRYLMTAGMEPVEEELPEAPWEDELMLRLRLREGVSRELLRLRYGISPDRLTGLCRRYLAAGLMEERGDSLALTPQGFLVSNTIISQLLAGLEQG